MFEGRVGIREVQKHSDGGEVYEEQIHHFIDGLKVEAPIIGVNALPTTGLHQLPQF